MLGWLRNLFGGASAPDFVLPDEANLKGTDRGLGIEILEPGDGPRPGPTDTVTVRYAGWLQSGIPFDSSYPGTASFPLNRVIEGWTEGLQELRPGGAARLLIPPHLGYGSRGAPPKIGPGATLVFHVELVKIG